MRPVSAPASAPETVSLRGAVGEEWRARSGRLFAEYRRQALMMVRRAFRGAFSEHELDDIYSGAWVGTLRALADRHAELTDDEIRSYVLTAVANQASRELRRRKRKPTADLEPVAEVVPDNSDAPEELALGEEDRRVARDLLSSLPKRRRAVMLLRYGWGLEPKQVCGLIDGLSPRAYRKEITKGIDQLTERMRALEAGEWCADREPLLKALVAGLADADEERQAKAHVAHCRKCSEFVARLGDHLNDLGGVVVASGAVEGIGGELRFVDRVGEMFERAREAAGSFSRGGVEEVGTSVASTGGMRGAGAAGAGVAAKLAGLGGAGKLAVACLGGGVAASACVAAGIGPLGGGSVDEPASRQAAERPKAERELGAQATGVEPTPFPQPGQMVGQPSPAPAPAPQPSSEPDPGKPKPAEAPVEPVAESAPVVEREFGVASAAVSPEPAPAPATSPSSTGGSGAGSATPVQEEFGP